ncbi:MAG: hypothetical protein KGL60_12760, partial [Pseudomonas sp.]
RSLTMTRAFWMNAALSGFSRASPLPQKSRSVFALVFAFAFNTQAGRVWVSGSFGTGEDLVGRSWIKQDNS